MVETHTIRKPRVQKIKTVVEVRMDRLKGKKAVKVLLVVQGKSIYTKAKEERANGRERVVF